MKIRFGLLSCVVVLVLFALVPVLYAADKELSKSLTFEDYVALPKLETVTEELTGTFAATTIHTMAFKDVEGVDRYYMMCVTGKGGGMGIKTLVHDYKRVRLSAKDKMAKLCGAKKPVVESDILYPTHFTTQFRCE